MTELFPTDIIHGRIVRISNTGNGILEYGDGEISIGPVKETAVGQEVDAVVYDQNLALCLTESARPENYDNAVRAKMGQLVDNPPADCPGLGDIIEIKLQGINSSRHGSTEYRGIPVRVRNIPEGASTGDVIPVKVYRLEQNRVLATGHTDIRLRTQLPNIGSKFSAIITRRTHSGKGLIESFPNEDINIGPIREGVVGEPVSAIFLGNGWAYCLDNSFVDDEYDKAMAVHVDDAAGISLNDLSERRRNRTQKVGENLGQIRRGRTSRSSNFRDQIVEAYDGTCAVCGQRIMDANSGDYFEIEAAHIFPVSGVEVDDATEGGPDTIKNGFALCRTHHWAFDNGWFTISDDYIIHIRGDHSQPGYEVLKQYEGVRLKLPEDESLWPAQYYLQAHRERV